MEKWNLEGVEVVEEVEEDEAACPHIQQGAIVARSLQLLKGSQQQLRGREGRPRHPTLRLRIRLPCKISSLIVFVHLESTILPMWKGTQQ
jgi:hypothetical protein